MTRYFVCIFLLLAGCSAKQIDIQEAKRNLKSQAEALGQAAVKEDFATLADFTHPTLIEKMGGREKYISTLESMAAQFRKDGFELKKYTLGEPSAPIYAFGDDYAVVYCELELSAPRGAKGRQQSYLIGVSNDGGINWKFVDGNGIGDDRSSVRTIFPNFPDEVILKPRRRPEWEK